MYHNVKVPKETSVLGSFKRETGRNLARARFFCGSGWEVGKPLQQELRLDR